MSRDFSSLPAAGTGLIPPPATDFGFLLHKHPERVQGFSLPFALLTSRGDRGALHCGAAPRRRPGGGRAAWCPLRPPRPVRGSSASSAASRSAAFTNAASGSSPSRASRSTRGS